MCQFGTRAADLCAARQRENAVRVNKADLAPATANLRDEYSLFAYVVTAPVTRVSLGIPADMLARVESGP